MPARQSGRRTQRTHVLGGCNNCRKRHAKCDQTRPECRMCMTANLKCQGYGSNVQWIREDGIATASEKLGTRAHLYTEEARSLMSKNMTEHFRSHNIDDTLTEIDTWSRGIVQSQSGSMVLGPFAVLDITPQELPSEVTNKVNDDVPMPEMASLPLGFNVNFNDMVSRISQDRHPTITSPSVFDSVIGLPDQLDWADLFNLDVEDLFDPGMTDPNMEMNGHLDHEGGDITLTNVFLAPVVSNSPVWSPLTEVMDEVLDKEVPALIHHFDTEVIGAIASLPFNQKSPYKILNVAAAVQTYADLTYLHRPVKHANIANLYGLLACSAQHLATNPSGRGITKTLYWQHIASSSSQKANDHLQASLRDELEGPNKARYKDQVMALMNLLAYAIAAGHQRDTHCYMVDIERLLRLRGLPKRHISRRARLLHHMYTWNRIVGESTYVLPDRCTGTISFSGSLPRPQKNNIARLDDFLRIEPDDEAGFGIVGSDTEPDVALRDVHLQDTRRNPNTMYLQIYGLPETWLCLLSQTTRLANMKTKLERDSRHEASLQKRITRLEDMICAFASNHSMDRIKAGRPPAQYMLQALSSALVIFFYRRIMDVNAMILQSYVEDVVNSLKLFDQSLIEHSLKGPGTAWPAFIAGCEAAPGSFRESILSWVESAYVKTGSRNFQLAKTVMEDVWTRRDRQTSPPHTRTRSHGNKTELSATWINLCYEKNTWVVLC